MVEMSNKQNREDSLKSHSITFPSIIVIVSKKDRHPFER